MLCMVFPLYDDNTGRRTTPVVNYVLIAANVFVWIVLQQADESSRFTMAFSTVPEEIVTGKDLVTPDQPVRVRTPQGVVTVTQPGLEQTPLSVYLTLLTSMFMHGSWIHLLGNMLFLWIFGDNVEDDLGHGRYLGFYLVCGVLASLAHVFLTVQVSGLNSPQARIPSLGASGAISGVLGGYILLHPHRQVTVLLFRFLTQVPAWVAIGMWFAFQVFSGLGDLHGQGGVAYGAHIGGFVAGLALVRVFAAGRSVAPEPTAYPIQRPRRW
jgi:membrane associated rhomboid family serine protease